TELLTALESAQSENERYKAALEYADGHLYTLVNTIGVVKARVRSHLMKAVTGIKQALKPEEELPGKSGN
ncbi:hypothetical protein LCGC14_1940810, partial [marine sediment metagenome]